LQFQKRDENQKMRYYAFIMHEKKRLAVGVLILAFSSGLRAAENEIDFSHDIVPVLRTHCGKCHLGAKKQGGFSMNTRDLLLAGGESGKAAEPGNSAASELIKRLTTDDPDRQMPPEGPRVPAEKIALLKKWIDAKLPWEPGFAFDKPAYEPPLKPRRPELPPMVAGRDNPVDRIVDAYFAEKQIARPELVDDAGFLRRVSLDLTGLLPEPERLAEFLADSRPNKRELLVQELLADDVPYAEHWLTFWNDLLRNDYTGTGFITGGRKQITKWLYRSLVDNKPFDQLVRELISPTAESEGFIQGIKWRGEVNSSQTLEVQFAQNISQALLGINMKCASCHDSFIDRWKLDEAYGLAAIYATEPLLIHRCDKPTGVTAQAAWIFPELGNIDPAASQPERLKQLADLMTHAENGRLTRTIVNRLWHRLMGRGIVHPVDAMHTPPWSADLLDYLAVRFADDGYDLRKMLALICSSQIYQARTPAVDPTGDSGPYLFRGPLARRMTAEQFVDAVWQITGAAPAKTDAQVIRGKLAVPSDGETSGEETVLRGRWIWGYADVSQAPAGEKLAFRRKFELAAAPVQAVAVITCDNAYTLYVNGQQVQSDDDWKTVEAVPLESQLKAGQNEIVIAARNAGNKPNAAALYFETRIRFADGTEETIATGDAWEATKTQPDARGKFKTEPEDWMPAAAVENPGIWQKQVGGALSALVSQSSVFPIRMVRASLVKSDYLMRTLGRPNRDQIVSMRPADLTTLEAIDLANGPILAEYLAQGARRLLQHSENPAGDVIQSIYRFALSRAPTDSESALAREMLGDQPTPERVEDLLWAVLMLPEFQLVR
jgi:hypothetical protein